MDFSKNSNMYIVKKVEFWMGHASVDPPSISRVAAPKRVLALGQAFLTRWYSRDFSPENVPPCVPDSMGTFPINFGEPENTSGTAHSEIDRPTAGPKYAPPTSTLVRSSIMAGLAA